MKLRWIDGARVLLVIISVTDYTPHLGEACLLACFQLAGTGSSGTASLKKALSALSISVVWLVPGPPTAEGHQDILERLLTNNRQRFTGLQGY